MDGVPVEGSLEEWVVGRAGLGGAGGAGRQAGDAQPPTSCVAMTAPCDHSTWTLQTPVLQILCLSDRDGGLCLSLHRLSVWVSLS